MSHQPQRLISIMIAACTIAGLGALCLIGDTPVPPRTSPLMPARGTAALRAYLNPETGSSRSVRHPPLFNSIPTPKTRCGVTRTV